MVLKVELVSPTARVWSGEATSVSARTIEGDIGILSNHSPLFGVLVDGQVVIHGTNGEATEFKVSGGFLSVANNRVSILTESIN
ncbi:MAG: ATP synthase F0F1 subunit epsilon [Actinobacteria bacterium BACL15 MAG-120619-bin91]|jgi:F-type H+-transporting ATPase subunit epsilon|uniref:ATP synthase F0F1 subunit epsilon n=3 Tax=Actinomycetes TaxID=1760 RepID=A0A0R2PIR5_9ACTN|nr:MAG: ATP synthase F0F1 subunit epsilon [Actinobacteria bacterium BACL15 MAG-120619-bin91]KRO37903.1 MAG: ATP synthase F0F1 subunit epsilon [Actinobacteria bacterium BACL15 MAG-120823-bin78]